MCIFKKSLDVARNRRVVYSRP